MSDESGTTSDGRLNIFSKWANVVSCWFITEDQNSGSCGSRWLGNSNLSWFDPHKLLNKEQKNLKLASKFYKSLKTLGVILQDSIWSIKSPKDPSSLHI